MHLAELVEVSRRVAATPGRLAKIGLLSDCLRRLPGNEQAIGTVFLAGRLRQGRIGLGVAAVGQALRGPPADQASLTLGEVDQAFAAIAATAGAGSAAARARLLGGLFGRATPAERDFLARLILGELRQGALEEVLAEAIAHAAQLPSEQVRRAVMVSGDTGQVAEAALGLGAAGLARLSLRPLYPVKPMLAQTADGLPEALARLGRAAVEYKLDGARVQLHKHGGKVRIFSRRLNEVSAALPELVEAASAWPDELILDGEALTFQPNGLPHPFQVTMRRFGRKLDVARLRQQLPLRAYFFDCLHLGGEDLTGLPLARRFQALAGALPPAWLVPRLITGEPTAGREFLERALRNGHEGVMVKALDAPYEAGNRGGSWLKVKPVHSLDLVVLAAEWGHGRRRGWLSNLHLAARDPDGGYVMLGKTFKGMTDAMLAWQTGELQRLAVRRDGGTVYVRPTLVVEVAFDGLQVSPHYPGGLALRFARVKRYRPDKRPEEADTIATVRALLPGAGHAPGSGRSE